MLTKKALSVFVLILALSSTAHAGVSYSLDEFEGKGLSNTVGILNKNGVSYAKNTLSPDFNIGPLGVGFDLNVFLPLNGNGNSDVSLAFRHVNFDYENKCGIKWGRLRHVTFGYGLLMDQYDSGIGGDTTEFTSQKAGVLAYGTLAQFRADVMWTASNVSAYRGSYTWEESPILGSSIVFGGNYVNDSDGVGSATGTPRQSQSGWSADIGLPIAGDFLTVFTEYAKLQQLNNSGVGGDGFSSGVKGNFGIADYRAEYRKLGAGFIPNYFNETYEASALPAVTSKERSGFLVSAGTSFFDGYVRGGLMYERYEDLDLLSAALGWKPILNTVGVINFSRPLNSNSAAVVNADITYTTGTWYDYMINIKRVYTSFSDYTETYSVGFKMNLSKVFPF